MSSFFLILALLIGENAFSKKQDTYSKTTKKFEPKSTSLPTHNTSFNKTKEEPKLKPAPLPTHNMGDEWEGVRKADDVSTYKLKSEPKVIATFHLQKQEKIIDAEKLKSKEVFKKFVQSKEEWLMMIGIREWKIDSHNIKNKKGFTELNVEGSYKRADDQQVFFKERQLFFLDSVYQILVISPKKKKLRSRSVRIFFKKAQEIELSQKRSQQIGNT